MAQPQYPFLGAKKDKKDRRDRRIVGLVGKEALPQMKYKIIDKFPVKNQFNRGSCTSQAQAHHKERQESRKSSARFVMAWTKFLEGNQEYGAYTRNSFKAVKKFGTCLERLYQEPSPSMSWENYIDHKRIPEKCNSDAKQHKSKSYWRVDKNLNAVKNALYKKKNSIVCSMNWFKEFNEVGKDGILPTQYTKSQGGHAVDLIGFDDFLEHLIFKNSWGSSWGNKGYFYMPYKIFPKVVWDCWCSLDLPEDLPVDDYYGRERTWKTFMQERAVAFNPWLWKKINRLPNDQEIKGLVYGHWSFESVFRGKVGDVWLKLTKPEAIKKKVIDKNENLLK